MDGTIIQQGSFISTGGDTTIQIRSDLDWMKVYNYDAAGGATQFAGVEFYWQRGFVANDALIKFHALGSQALSESTALVGVGNGGAVGGFTLVDSSLQTPGASVAFTALTATNPAVLTVASTALLRTGDIVRLSNIATAPQLAGIDWEITVVDGTHFSIPINLTVAGGAGRYRLIPFDPIFYPRRRFISSLVNLGGITTITTTVPHGYTVGQEVRFNIPSAFGTNPLDGMSSTISAIIDETSFQVTFNPATLGTFTFPLAAAVPFTPAEVIPFGEDTAFALSTGQDILADATINTAFIGIILAGGLSSPGGANGDLMYWVAGKSFNV